MAVRIHPVVKASLLAPLAVIPVGLLFAIGTFEQSGAGSAGGGFAADLVQGGGLYVGVALAVAYGVLLVAGLPLYFTAKWLGWVNYPAAILSAAVACFFPALLGGDVVSFWKIYPFLLANGIPIACFFVRMVDPR